MLKEKQFMFGFILLTLAGFLLGTLIPELLHMGSGSYTGLVSLYGLGQFEQKKLEPEVLFPYIVSVRLQIFIFLWMSCYTPLGLPAHTGLLLWLGMSAGMLISIFVLRHGYEGVLLFLCCVLPQWIPYGTVIVREIVFLEHKIRKKRAVGVGMAGNAVYYELRELVVMAAVCLLGCVLETVFGLKAFQVFLKYL